MNKKEKRETNNRSAESCRDAKQQERLMVAKGWTDPY